MTKQCVICGKEFETARSKQVTCGDADCKHIQHMEYLRVYADKKRREKRDEVNEYNRKWMREYRAGKKAETEVSVEVMADGYAERQMAKTLEMVGRVKI